MNTVFALLLLVVDATFKMDIGGGTDIVAFVALESSPEAAAPVTVLCRPEGADTAATVSAAAGGPVRMATIGEGRMLWRRVMARTLPLHSKLNNCC